MVFWGDTCTMVLRRRVCCEVTSRLVLALVMSILYCNSMLAGLPQTTIAPLQRVQKVTARLIFELGTREHVTASLLRYFFVQRLPVRWRVQFKRCCLVHLIFYGKCPAYLNNIVSYVDCGRPRRGVRSSSSIDFSLPRLRTRFGERAFSYAGPSAWNALPEDLKCCL